MIVRKLRLQRGWSQEQLAEMSGLSTRTIQRIERGQKAGLESLKSLAAVFEVQVSDLKQEDKIVTEEQVMGSQPTEEQDKEQQAMEYVRDLKGFYAHLTSYVVVMIGLIAINLFTSPDYFWAKWPLMGWGIGVISHGLSVFEVINLFGADWERKQVEKRLGRKL